LLFVPSPALTTNPVVLPQLPYDPQRDLAPVIMVTFSPFLLLVNNALPVNSVQELLAHLRANPGKLNHASNSASTRLVSELFKSLANVEYAEINYKGGALSAASVSSGETQLSFTDVGSATPLVRSGRVRALAVTTAERYKLRPEIPTLHEGGVSGYATAGLTVVMVPAKTPREIVARLNADLAKVIALPDVVERIEAVGNVVLGGSPEDAVQTLKQDAETWARLVSERNIRFQ
jgi:tripartite-type tricarboxylate transporter receptor subunit TctC